MSAKRSAAVVRRWVRLYTRGLPADIREQRRDEIDDDLWCQAADAATSGRPGRSLSGEVLARFLFGIPADLSWRAAHIRLGRGPATSRRSYVMNAPGRGLAAILGGIGWGIGLVVQGFVGRDWPTEGPVALTLMLAVVGGSWMLAGATVGLTMGAADRLRAPLALLAGLGAMVGAASLLGNYGWIVALPIGSAALMWELGRIGVLGTWMARAHVIAASLVLVVIGLWLANPAILDGPATAVPALSLGVPYGLSWVAIGWSLLRGASVRRRAALA